MNDPGAPAPFTFDAPEERSPASEPAAQPPMALGGLAGSENGAGEAGAPDSAKSGKARTQKQCRCSKCSKLPEGFKWLPTSTASDHASRDRAKGLGPPGGEGLNEDGSPSTPTAAKAVKGNGTGRKRGRPSKASILAAAEAAQFGGEGGSPSIYNTLNGIGMGMGIGMGTPPVARTMEASGSGAAIGGFGQPQPTGDPKPHVPVWSAPPPFLRKHLRFPSRIVGQPGPTHETGNVPFRPYITLTWAQSLDSKIAGPGGTRVILSGKESMEMTHWMRAMHHAIVIGVNTLLLDNPRLQVNYLPEAMNLSPPLIYILDPNLRTPTNARVLTEWTSNMQVPGQTKAARPTILCGAHMVWTARYRELEAAGAAIFGMQLDSHGHIPPAGLVNIFTSLGIRSAMIEGGSKVLSSFLHAAQRADGTNVVDTVVVTVAPTFIGEGVGIVPLGADVGLPRLKPSHTVAMGKDTVMICTV